MPVAAAPNEAQGTSSYTFTTTPRALASNRKKYRDPSEADNGRIVYNIMSDPRIKRGSTIPAPAAAAQALEMQRLEEEKQRKLKLARLRQKQRELEEANRPRTPEPVGGRQHIEIQTEVYLEEIVDRPIEKEADTQTDPLQDRPPSPVFIPQKSGVDASTQVWDGDLFDFDVEVEPLLSALVARTLEQSILEVREEEEIANMQKHQREFEAKRAAELAETQKMEEEELRKIEEKERRLEQERLRLEREHVESEKGKAREYAKAFITEHISSVISSLRENSELFYDPVVKDVKEVFVPWLLNAVAEEEKNQQLGRRLVDELLQNALQKARLLHEEAKKQQEREEKEEAERRDRARKEEEEKQRERDEREKGEEKDEPEEGDDDEQDEEDE